MVIIEKQSMIVLIVKKDKDPVLKKIPNRLDAMRKIIGNEFIEVVKYDNALLVFDAEGYKRLLPVNRIIEGLKVRGTFIIAGNDEYHKDFTDLTEQEIEKFKNSFKIEQELEEGEEME